MSSTNWLLFRLDRRQKSSSLGFSTSGSNYSNERSVLLAGSWQMQIPMGTLRGPMHSPSKPNQLNQLHQQKQLKKRNVEKNIRIRKLSQPANDPSRALILDKTLRRRKDDTKMVSCKVTDRKQVCPQRRKREYIMKNPG